MEGSAANPDTVAASFESKINKLSVVENNLVQMEMMFMGQDKSKECCGDKEACKNENEYWSRTIFTKDLSKGYCCLFKKLEI